MLELKSKFTQKSVPLILASVSQGRKSILEKMNVKFSIDPADIDEKSYKASTPEELVSLLAREKAFSAAKKYTDAVIIGADTLVLFNGEVIGKPANNFEAEETLLKLSGHTHQVITALAIIDVTNKRMVQENTISSVTFYNIPLEEIRSYIATGEPMGKAGAYGSQGLGSKFIKNIVGDMTNVVGLPKESFLQLLDKIGYTI